MRIYRLCKFIYTACMLTPSHPTKKGLDYSNIDPKTKSGLSSCQRFCVLASGDMTRRSASISTSSTMTIGAHARFGKRTMTCCLAGNCHWIWPQFLQGRFQTGMSFYCDSTWRCHTARSALPMDSIQWFIYQWFVRSWIRPILLSLP